MRTLSRWYEREHRPYAVDRQIIEGYAHWLKQVHWRLFCTFTFAWKVSDQQANKTFDEFINRLECHLKCDVGYVRGDEKRFSGCGKPACARHFHVLLTSTAPVIPETVELLWMSMAGKRADHAGAQVQPYNRNSSGASYVMKLTNQPDGNWESRKLHLFHPSARVEKITKRMRRHLHRHPLLAQQFMKDQAIGHK
jgi:hypothetical protein